MRERSADIPGILRAVWVPSFEIKRLLIARCSFEIFYLYRKVNTNYSVIYLIIHFRYDLSIQIVCRCVDGWSTSVATTQLPRFVSLSYQDTRRYTQEKMDNYKALQAHGYFLLFVWVGSKYGTCNIIIWKCFADSEKNLQLKKHSVNSHHVNKLYL